MGAYIYWSPFPSTDILSSYRHLTYATAKHQLHILSLLRHYSVAIITLLNLSLLWATPFMDISVSTARPLPFWRIRRQYFYHPQMSYTSYCSAWLNFCQCGFLHKQRKHYVDIAKKWQLMFALFTKYNPSMLAYNGPCDKMQHRTCNVWLQSIHTDFTHANTSSHVFN